jgi:ABC-type transport system substrate-binding protein/class 3 adenylate cyclase
VTAYNSAMEETAGERRNVAILIADVADSTVIGERLGPERSKFLFDEVVQLMSQEVDRFGGTVAQLTGDGLFAIFGAPAAHEDDSERAVRAARAIQTALARFGREVEDAYEVRLVGRVAVNTGPVMLLRADLPDEVRYNALGDTVNVAARLQSLAGEGGIAVGPATARQIERRFALEELGEVELKGKSTAVQAFRVVAEMDVEPAVTLTPFVGRASELETLRRVLDELLEGRGAIVSVLGEAGIGKTRLVAEAATERADVRFLAGNAVSYAETIPYWPVRELLRDWLRLGVSEPEARVRLELKAGLAAALGGDAEEVYPFLATVLGLSPEPDAADRLRQLSRDSVRRQTIDGVERLVRSLARERPLCLVVEDLHWADESTLDLLEKLLPVTEEEAVCLVLLYRSEREHRSWDLGDHARRRYPHRYHELELAALDSEASRMLAGGAAGAELPAAVAEELADRAGGNPFFLEEALRDLVERGALRREDGRYELAAGGEGLAIPELVQETLQARLDRLEADTREVLNVAAVVGRNFGLPLLERAAPRASLGPALSELQRLELVVEERRRPAPEYRFRHGLVQEVAYATLVEQRRRELHGSVGRALEELHRDSPSEVYGLLAGHFSEADEADPAVEYLLKAGDAARAVYANEQALEHYGAALGFMHRAGDAERARKTLFKVALTHHLAFDFQSASRAWDEALSYAVDPQRLEPTARLQLLFEPVWGFVPGYALMPHNSWFAQHLFRGLVRFDDELDVVPDLATELTVSADGRTYRFRLGPDARWSDGVPVTADDFVYGWRRTREERLDSGWWLEEVEAANALDDRTLEVKVRAPRNYFPYLLAAPWAFPWPRHRCEALGDGWREPAGLVGNGPFVLAEFDRERALLVASPTWSGARGNVERVEVAFSAEDKDKVAAWRAGDADVTTVEDGRVLDHGPETVAEVVGGLNTAYIGYRTDRRPFDNELVRKAFSHAVDRNRPLGGGSSVARPAGRGGFLPPAMPGHSHRISPPFDLELAPRLLAEAGFPGGEGLPEIEVAVPEYHGATGRDLAEQWRRLGARVKVLSAPLQSFPAAYEVAHAWCWGWLADFPDPEAFFSPLLAVMPVFRDEEISALLGEARARSDQDERMALFREIDRLLVAERCALLPTTYGASVLLCRPWVHGLRSSPLLGPMTPLDQVVVRR